MTKNEWIDFIIKTLHENGITWFDYHDREFSIAMSELMTKGYVRKNTTYYHMHELTPSGFKLAESGLSYIEWIKKDHSKEVININVGDKIKGHKISKSKISHSDLSTQRRNFSMNPPMKTHSKQSKAVDNVIIAIKWIIRNIWKILLAIGIASLVTYFKLNK